MKYGTAETISITHMMTSAMNKGKVLIFLAPCLMVMKTVTEIIISRRVRIPMLMCKRALNVRQVYTASSKRCTKASIREMLSITNATVVTNPATVMFKRMG